jgi:RimJ/RimL family protein N-acetyltransferase
LRLVTERLIVRPAVPADADDLYAVLSDPFTFEYIGSDPMPSLDATRALIARKMAVQAEHGFSLWTVEERETGRVVGDCGLHLLEGGPEVELGYKLGRESRGRGYATEAGRVALAYGFEELGLERIVAVAHPANRASWRVMEKLGMTFVGRGHHYGNESVLYELTKAGFATQAGSRPRR